MIILLDDDLSALFYDIAEAELLYALGQQAMLDFEYLCLQTFGSVVFIHFDGALGYYGAAVGHFVDKVQPEIFAP